MEPSSSTTSRKRALSMSDLCESDGKKAKNTSVYDSVGNTGSKPPNMPHATAAHISAPITGMSIDLQSGLFHGAHNFVVTGSQFTEIVNNYHCPTTSVYAACALRPLRPLDARNIDRHTIGKLIHAVTARYHGTSNSDASLIALLKVLREKRPGEHVMTVVPLSTVDFMTYLLSMRDYAKIPSKVDNKMDVLSLMDLIVYLLDHDLLRVTTSQEGNRRARRLMIKLGLKFNGVPRSVLIHKDDIKLDNNLPMDYGGFSNIYEGSYRGNRVAIKRLRLPVAHKHFNHELFIREALIWRTFSHDYMLPYFGTYEDSGFVHLVSPFMENGTLDNWRIEMNPSALEVETMVAKGVQYLHYEGVIHFDLCSSGSPTLVYVEIQTRPQPYKRFVAPELLVDEGGIGHTKKTDIYDFGCLYYEIHFNSVQIYSYAIQQVKRGERPPRMPNPPLEDEAWNLIERCWDHDPIKRPSIDDVVDIMNSWRRKSSDCESEWDDDF